MRQTPTRKPACVYLCDVSEQGIQIVQINLPIGSCILRKMLDIEQVL